MASPSAPFAFLAGDDQGATALLEEHRRRSSRRLSWVALGTVGISFPFVVGVYFTVTPALGLGLLGVSVVAAAVEGMALWLFHRGLHRPWMDLVATVIEALVPTAVFAFDLWQVGPAYAMTAAPSLLFVVVLLLSAMRLRPWLSLVSGLVCAVGLLGGHAWARAGLSPELVQQIPSLSWESTLQRFAYVALSGVGAFWIGRSLLSLIRDLDRSSRRQLEVRAVLGRQVSDAVAEEILSGRAAVGQKRTVTVLFADIRSFTRFSESRDPAEVVEFLNTFLAAMVGIVHRHGGLVNKFLGDGLMALFGVPSDDPQQAEHAVRAALEMQTVVSRTRASWGVEELRIGIGMHTGEAVVGVIGSRERSEYTAIGDAVNLASRIEALNKKVGSRILLSAETRAHLGSALELVSLGAHPVPGREQPVEIFELVPPECSKAKGKPTAAAPDASPGKGSP